MIQRWSIARRLFAANLLFVVALTAIVGTAVFLDARDHAYDEAGRRMAGIATTVAASGCDVRYLDMSKVLTGADLDETATHPSRAGFDKMADVWYPAVRAL